MAGKNRRSVPDLKTRMLESGSSFSFFQVVRLLNKMDLNKPGSSNPDNGIDVFSNSDKKNWGNDFFKNLKIKPNLSLGFPLAAIENIKENQETGNFDITANFLSLYGTLSPLPSFYTEDLFEEERLDEAFVKDFLNIINQRLYELLFLSWSKYRSMIQLHEMGNDTHKDRLFCLGGFGDENLRKQIKDPFELLRYIGLFAMPTRSQAGLETLLGDALGYEANITPCLRKRSPIPKTQRFYLGQENTTLSVDGYLGHEIPDCLGKFKISFGPLDDEEFRKLLPGTKLHMKMIELINLYLSDPFLITIEILILDQYIQTTTLNQTQGQWGRLGLDTWVFSQKKIKTPSASFKGIVVETRN
ncbi:MAG: type VI secretion system baseplate subunit TssG [Desulfobacteraceae bacterium]|nr:type VI secretion system baseplate subunit TssG [Desulfobacteraceae bacterium]